MKNIQMRKAGFTLVEIMIVVAIIGLLLAVMVPNFVRARETSQQNACINNLRQIDGAAQTWALENRKLPSDPYSLSVIKAYVKVDSTGQIPPCPGGGTYAPGASVGVSPTCTQSTATRMHMMP
jgi:prepilin-type N-terminal cleavage/methylation domain-containing protein